MSFIEHEKKSNVECQTVLSAFNTFFQKLTEDEWLSQTSKEEMKSCLQSARNVEKILASLEASSNIELFFISLPNSYGFELNQLCKACDIILTAVLTASGISLSCVRTCIEEYFKLCGSARFQSVLSTVILTSEIYRVLLDFIASSDGNFNHSRISLQSQIFYQMWKIETDTKKLRDTFYKWLRTDTSGELLAISLMVITTTDGTNIVCSSLVSTLSEVLGERGELATLFWKVICKYPQAKKAFEKSNELLNSAFEFLKESAEVMEATTTMSWVPRDKGHCHTFGFDEIVTAVQCLLETPGYVSIAIKDFLFERKKSAGCFFWDDVCMKLNDY